MVKNKDYFFSVNQDNDNSEEEVGAANENNYSRLSWRNCKWVKDMVWGLQNDLLIFREKKMKFAE